MVPVLDSKKKPLMPCSEKRAKKLMEKGEAKAYWRNGIFCVILQKEPSHRHYQDVIIGVDPGSKREGYTVTTDSKVVLNILSDTPSDVKNSVETKRNLRRSRRNRKTPYRKVRFNRVIGGIPPSTKARWGAKLRVTRQLQKILPITHANIEDIKAKSIKNARKWNVSFSPLEVGKQWFYGEVEQLGIKVFKTTGYETKEQRDQRGFKKTGQKLKLVWEAHCVDSHALCEIATGNEIVPFKGMYQINLFKFSRRQLHVQNPSKGGIRKLYGGTVSDGIAKGTLVNHFKYGKTYLGGSSKGLFSLHNVGTGKRITQKAKKVDIKTLSKLNWRTAFLPALKNRVSSRAESDD